MPASPTTSGMEPALLHTTGQPCLHGFEWGETEAFVFGGVNECGGALVAGGQLLVGAGFESDAVGDAEPGDFFLFAGQHRKPSKGDQPEFRSPDEVPKARSKVMKFLYPVRWPT